MTIVWRWQNFTPAEMACKDGTPFPLNNETAAFMDKLQALRVYLGFPLIINSAYRTATHNASVGGAKNSAHLYGRAVDIQIYGRRAYLLVSKAERFFFTGIGIGQKLGSPLSKRIIHLDDMDIDGRPTIWSY